MSKSRDKKDVHHVAHEVADNIDNSAQNVSLIESIIASIKKELFSEATLLHLAHRVRVDFGWLSLVTSALLLPLNMYRIYHGIFISKDHRINRAIQVTAALGGTALGIIGILVAIGVAPIAVPILIIVGAAKSTFENTWNFCSSIYDRFFGKGAITQQKITDAKEQSTFHLSSPDEEATASSISVLTSQINKQRDRNAYIATKAHSVIQSAAALTGAIMLFTPLAPIGAIILAVTAAYGFADVINLNPFKWAARGINFVCKLATGRPLFDPFAHKTEDEVRADLLNKMRHEKPLAKSSEPVMSDTLISAGLSRAPSPEAASLSVLPSERVSSEPIMIPSPKVNPSRLFTPNSPPSSLEPSRAPSLEPSPSSSPGSSSSSLPASSSDSSLDFPPGRSPRNR